MQIKNNKLEFIKKNRPKIKIGDYFCFNINKVFYTGVVLHNHLDKSLKENTMITVLVLNYHEKSIDDISSDKLVSALKNRDLLIPPMNINRLGWTKGFFLNIGNIESSDFKEEIIEKCRFFYGLSTIYNMEFKEVKDIPNYSLIGKTGIYNHLGLESMVQISLDLEFTEPNPEGYNPYEYYDELKTKYSNLELPFWYYKARERLG
ncbi:Imm26 family immunity protein [Zobellia galactanivorans]|uniref:Imm26 family immunity protein n=1 Tax=Zobellia galactanivorans (strain DSM 12802 / CCUG 47099 / CIP 106680 / NCIMB 13871 / Dsij) TaxID=63186 RepID=UPI0026E3813E|nr:Imm26 family immunity protein [Zobellia galactanivorans]MDO6811274.1 Imm26 family immunity protein [Zobellia galactanivorans]